MKNNKFFWMLILVTILVCVSQVHAMPGNQFAPPRYNTIDEMGVNLTTGQITSNLNTVSIGGSMGLNHNISILTNNVSNDVYGGYYDRFSGAVRLIKLGNAGTNIEGMTSPYPVYVMRAHAMGDSADFKVMVNGVYTGSSTLASGYSYEALGDTRHTLEVSSDELYLLWTKPDGTIVKFIRGTSPAPSSSSSAAFVEIIYPNGFTISLHTSQSVTTNTGFQLKYDYIEDDRPLESSKLNVTLPSGNNVPNASVVWSQQNPKYIHGINNAVEYCNPSQTEPCDLSVANSWPKATFNWPGGMPKALYIGDSIFSVTDYKGGVNEYHYQSQNLGLADPNDPSRGYLNGDPNGYWASKYSPRLVAVVPSGSSEVTKRYTYNNQFIFNSVPQVFPGLSIAYAWVNNEAGEVKEASGINGYYHYWGGNATGPYAASPVKWRGYLASVTSRVDLPTALLEMNNTDGYYYFESSYRNNVTIFIDNNGPTKAYGYDSRGNLNSVTFAQQEEVTAYYPETCTNRKTCNQPEWTKDAKGNYTYYTYHSESGQLQNITYSPNDQGKVAQTRYEYQEMYAYIKDSLGNRVRVNTPIWLKVAERSCADSNYQGNSCADNDEVVVAYEYNHDNLFMTGMTVTTDNQTLRTCYAYDRYGNQIGETAPNANLASCI